MSVIDNYLKNVSAPQKRQPDRIRKIVWQTAPGAEEVISYGIPDFKYKHKYLVGFAAYKDHLSLFPTSAPIEKLGGKLGDFKLSRGTIQFTVDNPIPEPIIRDLVGIRLANILKE